MECSPYRFVCASHHVLLLSNFTRRQQRRKRKRKRKRKSKRKRKKEEEEEEGEVVSIVTCDVE